MGFDFTPVPYDKMCLHGQSQKHHGQPYDRLTQTHFFDRDTDQLTPAKKNEVDSQNDLQVYCPATDILQNRG